MAQRSNRRFPNLISEEVLRGRLAYRAKAGGIHHGQELLTPPKAEYICADQTAISSFRLQTRGGPYIPIFVHNARLKTPIPRSLEAAVHCPIDARRPETNWILSGNSAHAGSFGNFPDIFCKLPFEVIVSP